MNHLINPGFLFRWSIPVLQIPSLPHRSGRLLDLPEQCRLPFLGELDGRREFADVRLAWNSEGLAISVAVAGRSRPLKCSADSPTSSDGLTVWIDTRNTQGVHRATRYCHQFCLLPAGGGRKSSPVVSQIPLARAREEYSPQNLAAIALQAEVHADSYLLEAWLPASVFVGFDPANYPRLGFHYLVHDLELGSQSLSVQSEFPVASDPNLWQTLELGGSG